MMRSQGKYFSEHELNRIITLLRDSDMTLPEIASRMRCSRSAVAAINRKFQIRFYGSKRSEWRLSSECVEHFRVVESREEIAVPELALKLKA